MNEDDLQQKLRALVAPPATDVARERARHRALMAFRAGGVEAVPEFRRGGLAWALAGAAAVALATVFFWPRELPSHRAPSGAAVLAQVEALFPRQLDAVIEHDGEVQLALAAEPRLPSDQPVVVEFRRGDSIVRVLSYSGRHVCVDLGGRRACFEAFLGERGTVIVAGEDFVWTPTDRATTGEWKITAAALERAS